MGRRKDESSRMIELFSLYEKKMYHIAYAILHDAHQAEDAVMDAFVRLLEREYVIEDITSDAAKSLIISVTRSAAIDLYRKNRREREQVSLSEDPVSMSSEEERAFTTDSGSDVDSMIKGLPEKYRDVLHLRYAKELSTAEIAGRLGISEAAVRKRQERALRMLKKNNEGGFYGTKM